VATESDDVSARVAWFAGRLRELREAAGLGRKELAARAGMRSEAGVRNLEQGVRSPSWETVLRLAAALRVDVGAFTQEPAARAPAPPGRPPQATAGGQKPVRLRGRPAKPGPAAGEKPKRHRGRPRQHKDDSPPGPAHANANGT
jgi:transcriptional regulator with XRE-family HTH domain